MTTKKFKKWCAYFSNTGNEIAYISTQLNRWPDLIVTNKADLIGINEKLYEKISDREIKIIFLPRWPDLTDYLKICNVMGYNLYDQNWKEEVINTLHGFLRLIPGDFCHKSYILNGHPGLITEYPELKGFNPQQKTWDNKEKYPYVGCVIHKVIPEVDSGEIVSTVKFKNTFTTLGELYNALHNASTTQWYYHLSENL